MQTLQDILENFAGVWVKASERKPDNAFEYVLIKVDDRIGVGKTYGHNTHMACTFVGWLNPYQDVEYSKVFWLDPSPEIKAALLSLLSQQEEDSPLDWKPTKLHIKSGWKNNPNVLSQIVTAINDEIYIEDESEFMEKVDIILEWIKEKYCIYPKPQPPKNI